MQLNVLLFASYADAFGTPSLGVSLPEGATVDDLLAAVREMAKGTGLPPAAIAVNQEYVGRGHALKAGDEVALIPPVAGG
jgi:molybdopterin converting factor subunit 1